MKKKDYNFEDDQEKIGFKDVIALIVAAFQVIMPFFLVGVGIMVVILLFFTKVLMK